MKLAIACEDRNIYLFDEQGNYKEHFSNTPSDEVYEIVQILFNPESTKLAVAQSNNVILIYELGSNWGDNKIISNIFKQNSKITCMIWPKMDKNELIFGLDNGEIKQSLLSENKEKTLYSYSYSCVSISSSIHGKFIISGHKDNSFLKYNIENPGYPEFFSHSCIPICLACGAESNILVAGNDHRIIIYNSLGQNIKVFDHSKENDIKEFLCYSICDSGNAIALGNNNIFYIYLYNDIKHSWEEFYFKNNNCNYITSICWKPDRTALVTGNVLNSIDLFEIKVNYTSINIKDYLSEQNNYESKVKSLIQEKKWENAIELVNKVKNINPQFYINIGKHFESKGYLDRAEEYYIKGGEFMLAFNMYVNSIKPIDEEKESKLREYKQFFEQIENKKKLLSQKKMQFSEEENRRIIQKFNELKTILFNKDNNNKTTKVFMKKYLSCARVYINY